VVQDFNADTIIYKGSNGITQYINHAHFYKIEKIYEIEYEGEQKFADCPDIQMETLKNANEPVPSKYMYEKKSKLEKSNHGKARNQEPEVKKEQKAPDTDEQFKKRQHKEKAELKQADYQKYQNKEADIKQRQAKSNIDDQTPKK
jgi:hypothetical protein